MLVLLMPIAKSGLPAAGPAERQANAVAAIRTAAANAGIIRKMPGYGNQCHPRQQRQITGAPIPATVPPHAKFSKPARRRPNRLTHYSEPNRHSTP